MRRLLAGILAGALFLGMCACGNRGTEETQLSEATEETVQAADVIQTCSETLASDPDNVDALLKRAGAYEERAQDGDLELAKADYEKALESDEKSEAAYDALSDLYLRNNEVSAAIELLESAAVKLDSDLYAAKAERLSVWTREQRWQEQYDLGQELVKQEQYAPAVDAFAKAIEIDNVRPESFVARADTILLLKDETLFEQALQDYQEALSLSPDQEALYIKLSDLYNVMGNTEESVAVLLEGAEQLKSEALSQLAVSREADRYSDEELLNLATEKAARIYYFIGGIINGSEFKQDFSQKLVDADGKPWFPVIEENINSLADIEHAWYEEFSVKYPVPELSSFAEIDGKLYTNNPGVGDDISLQEFVLTTVESRDGTSVRLSGYALRWKFGSGKETDESYKNDLYYSMEYEDGKWKCSEFEEIWDER